MVEGKFWSVTATIPTGRSALRSLPATETTTEDNMLGSVGVSGTSEVTTAQVTIQKKRKNGTTKASSIVLLPIVIGVANLETHILARAFLEARNVHWSVENASACVE